MRFFGSGAKAGAMVEEMDPATLRARLADGDPVQVVDIRPTDEFERGHIPGAINVPLTRFAREVDRHEWGRDIVVACPIGESSRQAARLLSAFEGVPDDATISNLSGGYRAWDGDLERS